MAIRQVWATLQPQDKSLNNPLNNARPGYDVCSPAPPTSTPPTSTPPHFAAAEPILPCDFDLIRKIAKDDSAIILKPGKEYLVESRLIALAKNEGVGSIKGLIERLKWETDGYIRKRILEALTTNETSFFRDLYPFEALRKTIVPKLVALNRSNRELNIWCGAASTGQEPYSMLMLLAEHFPELLGWRLRFHATDLNGIVLERARRGRFTQHEVNRGLPAAMLVKYFVRIGSEWEIKPEIRNRVHFHELNLVKAWPTLPMMDLVLLRNVLIYFDLPSKQMVLTRIRRQLKTTGCLMLGGAETTLGIDDAFERIAVDNSSYYQLKR